MNHREPNSANENAKSNKHKKDGLVIEYGDKGNVVCRCYYKDGCLEGICSRFDDDGLETFTGFYRNGLLHGQVLKYDKNSIVNVVEHDNIHKIFMI